MLIAPLCGTIHGTSATAMAVTEPAPLFVNATEPDGFWPAGAATSLRGFAGCGFTAAVGGAATSRCTGTVGPLLTETLPSYVPAGCELAVMVTLAVEPGRIVSDAGEMLKKLPLCVSVTVAG